MVDFFSGSGSAYLSRHSLGLQARLPEYLMKRNRTWINFFILHHPLHTEPQFLSITCLLYLWGTNKYTGTKTVLQCNQKAFKKLLLKGWDRKARVTVIRKKICIIWGEILDPNVNFHYYGLKNVFLHNVGVKVPRLIQKLLTLVCLHLKLM